MSPLSTSNSNTPKEHGNDFRSLVLRFLIFASPLILILAVFEIAFWKTGEAWPIQRATAYQQKATGEVIYGRAFFSQQFNVYKLAGIRHHRPAILAIGSSRVLQIRAFMFAPLDDKFYNAGGLIQNVYDISAFADLLSRGVIHKPSVLLVGIDPWWLKSGRGHQTWLNANDRSLKFSSHIEAMREVIDKQRYVELFKSYKRPDAALGLLPDTIGINARVNGSGFRKDGSRHYSPRILIDYLDDPRYVDRERPPVVERIKKRKRQFSLPADINPQKQEILLGALSKISQLDIELHVMMPPFSSEVIEALERSDELKNWWHTYRNELPQKIQAIGISVLEVQSPVDFGLDDRYMIDGFHPGEVYMAHLVSRVVQKAPPGSILQQVDAQKLSSRIASAAIPLAFEIPRKVQ